jgi:DNA uptake protein ComE-like DNA-binding protein
MRLPGVDATTADKIIAARPFKARNQLLDKKILTKQEYERIHAMLTVGHPPKEAAKK